MGYFGQVSPFSLFGLSPKVALVSIEILQGEIQRPLPPTHRRASFSRCRRLGRGALRGPGQRAGRQRAAAGAGGAPGPRGRRRFAQGAAGVVGGESFLGGVGFLGAPLVQSGF